jgi:hypothetical protein
VLKEPVALGKNWGAKISFVHLSTDEPFTAYTEAVAGRHTSGGVQELWCKAPAWASPFDKEEEGSFGVAVGKKKKKKFGGGWGASKAAVWQRMVTLRASINGRDFQDMEMHTTNEEEKVMNIGQNTGAKKKPEKSGGLSLFMATSMLRKARRLRHRQNEFSYYRECFITSIHPLNANEKGGEEIELKGQWVQTKTEELRVAFRSVVSNVIRIVTPVSSSNGSCKVITPAFSAGPVRIGISVNHREYSNQVGVYTGDSGAPAGLSTSDASGLHRAALQISQSNAGNDRTRAEIRADEKGDFNVGYAFWELPSVRGGASPANRRAVKEKEAKEAIDDSVAPPVVLEYLDPPEVGQVAPLCSPLMGGTRLTVMGKNFYQAPLIEIDFADAQAFRYMYDRDVVSAADAVGSKGAGGEGGGGKGKGRSSSRYVEPEKGQYRRVRAEWKEGALTCVAPSFPTPCEVRIVVHFNGVHEDRTVRKWQTAALTYYETPGLTSIEPPIGPKHAAMTLAVHLTTRVATSSMRCRLRFGVCLIGGTGATAGVTGGVAEGGAEGSDGAAGEAIQRRLSDYSSSSVGGGGGIRGAALGAVSEGRMGRRRRGGTILSN